ncbi:hypothetical protein LUZ60_009223 [Juncus effusus]|nr:hypothetical protein LUZ60_009223 [Juncus effusus]
MEDQNPHSNNTSSPKMADNKPPQNKSPSKYPSSSSSSGSDQSSVSRSANPGILNEQILSLIFRRLNWDPQALCSISCASRRLRAVSERVLFFELCKSRAPKLVSSLNLSPIRNSPRVPGGWPAMAKLLLFCCGCNPSKFFRVNNGVGGHFAPVSRFSKTSGKSFLRKNCWGDVLYVSDPCEHACPNEGEDMDLGAYRGVFCGFVRSRTRAFLIKKHIELETRVRCPYCSARVWSMTAAGLVPKSASRRLGAHQGMLEYFVCVNGHMHGNCWLAHLSSDDDDGDDDDDEEECDGDETMAW